MNLNVGARVILPPEIFSTRTVCPTTDTSTFVDSGAG